MNIEGSPADGYLNLTAGYSKGIYDNAFELGARATEALRGVDYDTLVGQGLSGACMLPILARALNKPFCVIRKEEERSHGIKDAEGYLGHRWVFVDDFISSGSTLRRCVTAINRIAERHNHRTQFVGSYLYQRSFDQGFYPATEREELDYVSPSQREYLIRIGERDARDERNAVQAAEGPKSQVFDVRVEGGSIFPSEIPIAPDAYVLPEVPEFLQEIRDNAKRDIMRMRGATTLASIDPILKETP